MKKLIYFIILLIIISAGAFFYARNWYNSAINESGLEPGKEINFTVAEGDTFMAVVERLESEGLIKSATAVKIYLKLENLSPNIKFGNYAVDSGTNLPELIRILEQGVFKPGIQITFKEGLRFEQVADLLEENLGTQGTFSKQRFLDIAQNPDSFTFTTEIDQFLAVQKPAGETLEGFLYPDTYEFDPANTEEEIISKFLENFILKVEDNLNLTALNLNQNNVTTLYEAMILGSIVEEEASAWDDRKEIAGVFHNRLENFMHLNSDATVNYITGKNDAGATIADTRIDSPYNTYLYIGLPPAPISSPRIESIVASLYPNTTDSFYFLHTEDGQTYYSETLYEHNIKVEQYLGTN